MQHPTEKGDGVKIRSALLIAGSMLAGILLIAASTHTPASFRMPPSAPVVYSQPRTELLPPIRALYDQQTTTTTTTAPAPPPKPVDTVTPWERVAWTRVAVCEEGGWIGYAGYAYPDSLGISRVNWFGNGGGSDLSEDTQIMVAERIQTDPPDQGSCASW